MSISVAPTGLPGITLHIVSSRVESNTVRRTMSGASSVVTAFFVHTSIVSVQPT